MAGRRVLGLAAGLLACVVVGAVGASTLSATTLGATSLGDPVGTTSYNGATTESSTGQPTARTTNGATEQTISVQPTTGRHDSTGPSSAAAGFTSSTADRTEPRLSSTGTAKQTPGSIGDVSKHAAAATEPSASTWRTSNGEVTKHSEDSRQTGTTTNETPQTEDRLTTRREADELTTNSVELTTDNDYRTTDEARTTDRHSTGLAAIDSSSLFTPSAELNISQTDKGTSPSQLEIVVEESTEVDGELGTTDEPTSTSEPVEVVSTTSLTSSTPSTSTTDDHPAPDLADKDSRDLEDAYHNEVPDDVRRKYKLSHPFLIGTRTAAKSESSATSSSPSSGRSFVLYRNYDVDSQERERELEERAREQNHPADLEDTNVHEVNHYVPEDEHEDPEVAEKVQQQQQRSVARWYLLLLAGNSTTVRLRQKDFAKYLKLNLAARLSVEYNDLRVNRVEFKPLLMVNVTIFSRPKDNEEAPLHMLADTNATLLELSGEEYHVVRFITIPNDETLASLASGGFQADSYTGVVPRGTWHVDMGVAVYFAIAAALVSILLAVFLVGLWRYVRGIVGEVQWPWRRYKPYSLPRWSLPLQHRLCADHIVHCAPLRTRASRQHGHHVWTTGDGGGDEVPVQKILAPEPPQRLVLTSTLPHLLGGEAAPSTADTLLQTQPAPLLPPAPAPPAPAAPARPNLKLSLFGSHCDQVLQPDRPALGGALGGTAPAGRNRLQPQGRHPLDVRIGPTVLGLDNPNYMLQ